MSKRKMLWFAGAAAVACFSAQAGHAEPDKAAPAAPLDTVRVIKLPGPAKPDLAKQPWLDPSRDPDSRADLALSQMTLDEKIQLLHGSGFLTVPLTSNGGAGYTPGIKRLGIPDLNMADSTVGVTRGAMRSRYSTLMPATIAEAASWNPQLAYRYAALVGQELRDQGSNASLAGGANLAREPRSGRTFEYRGEDPVLAGTMAAQAIRGMQAQGVIGDLKHYAFNDQETGRHSADVVIDPRAGHESDLLAFELAVRDGQPGMVMCAYNRVWGDYACENSALLNQILKGEWGFKGWVVSDWGATHSTEKAVLAGLDQEQPGDKHFGDALKAAVLEGRVPERVVDASVHRILRTLFALVVDNPPKTQVVDPARGLSVARAVETEGAVLLKNDRALLPLARWRTIAVIGGHADVGVLTGGGSGQVDPPGGNAVKGAPSETIITTESIIFPKVWWPSSPLQALRTAAPGAHIVFDDGQNPAQAAAVAAKADVAIVFAYAPSAEENDNASMSLPDGQDALISAVASANPRTTVVLETTGAVTMPWIDKVGAVVAAWFPGAAGGEAVADLLVGKSNFSGKLPISFPRSEADLPHPRVQGWDAPMVIDKDSIIPGLGLKTKAGFEIRYDEGALVGYKWFQAKAKRPLFAFGHGLSYTRFAYSALHVAADAVSFTVANTGPRAGVEVAQVYVELPAGARLAPRQLVGWSRIDLKSGEKRTVTVKFEPLAVSTYDVQARAWRRPVGRYRVFVGGASDSTPLVGQFDRP